MKSNLITKIIVTCLCMWAIGMAADQNQEIKSINEGVKTQVKLEANVELQKKMALKEKALMQATIKATMQAEKKSIDYQATKKIAQMKATDYQNAKKAATMKSQSVSTSLEIGRASCRERV